MLSVCLARQLNFELWRRNAQDHRTGGSTLVSLDKPKNSIEANDVEKSIPITERQKCGRAGLRGTERSKLAMLIALATTVLFGGLI